MNQRGGRARSKCLVGFHINQEGARVTAMPARKECAPKCCICSATNGTLDRASVSSHWYNLSYLQKQGSFSDDFHPAAFSRLRDTARVLVLCNMPADGRCCSTCTRDWTKHIAAGGRSALQQRLRAEASAAREAAGLGQHPMAHGDLDVRYWSPGERIGNITCDTLVVRRSDNKAIFAFVLDAFGLDADELAKLNRQIVEMGNPVKRSAVRTGKGGMVVTGFRLCRHDGTLDRYKSDGVVVPFEDGVLADLIDKAAVWESELLRLCMPCQWAEMQEAVRPGTYATLHHGQHNTPVGLKSVTAHCELPQHVDPGDICSFLAWYFDGEGLAPPRGGKFRLDGPGGPGIEFQPTHGCACFFNTAELYHGTDALEDCEGCQIQIGTALVLKKSTQTAAANQAAQNEVFMAAANKVKRQEKEAKMAEKKKKQKT